ncbi:RagB/SusD family nutrient uptake outer membrane protein [Saccharicrinis aurantiacus]|uniref:RagB/SusD family nutrient uptake outer membrane protein n=1 Tax=Saccharicrinis aurantiacus TaxID=1849719 RepID=UPI0024917B3E|nr:RagB/SusD family nutrient uptake outer membrane protein [Saccharicrinis aurantiacus]
MKNNLKSRFVYCSIMVSVLFFSVLANSSAQTYRVSFGIVDETGSPELVKVRNNTTGEELSFTGDEILHLVKQDALAVKPISDDGLKMNVYPNPVYTKATIEFHSSVDESCLVSVYDIVGRLILNKKMEVNKGTYMLGLSGLASGTYIVKVNGETQQCSQSIVVIGNYSKSPKFELLSYSNQPVVTNSRTDFETLKASNDEAMLQMKYSDGDSFTFTAAYNGDEASISDFTTNHHAHLKFNYYYRDHLSWTSLVDCEKGLIDVYKVLRSKYTLQLLENNKRSDLASPSSYSRAYDNYYQNTFTNESSAGYRQWNQLYKGVFRAQKVVEALGAIKPNMTSADELQSWSLLMGEARFFRGLFYFWLHSAYNGGSVLLFDKAPQCKEDYNLGYEDESVIRDHFIADLEYAYGALLFVGSKPKESETPDDIQFEARPTKGAAASILGQSYLYQADYVAAKSYFEDVINNSEYAYALTTDPEGNVSTRNELNSESIFEIVYLENLEPGISLFSEESTSSPYLSIVSPVETQWGTSALYPSYWLQMAYKKDSMDVSDSRNMAPVVEVSSGELTGVEAIRKYNLRASAYIAFVDDEATKYYLARPAVANRFNNKCTAAFKMLSNCNEYTYLDNRPNSDTYESGVNHRLIRLADVYLMYAECLIKGGSDETGVDLALSYINKIRYRSALLLCGLPTNEFPNSDFDDKIYSANDVMEQLMYIERPLEISILGHATRHIDLRRWGIYKERLDELSQRRYAFGSYPQENWTLNTDGTRMYTYPNNSQRIIDPSTGQQNILRWFSILYEDSYYANAVDWAGNPPEADYYFDQEYQVPADNYNESEHAYWPIPLDQINRCAFSEETTYSSEVYDPIEPVLDIYTYDSNTKEEKLYKQITLGNSTNSDTFYNHYLEHLDWNSIELSKGDSIKLIDRRSVGKPDVTSLNILGVEWDRFFEHRGDSSVVVNFNEAGTYRVYMNSTREQSGAYSSASLYVPLRIIVKDDAYEKIKPVLKVYKYSGGTEELVLDLDKDELVQLSDSLTWPELLLEYGDSLKLVDETIIGNPTHRQFYLNGLEASSYSSHPKEFMVVYGELGSFNMGTLLVEHKIDANNSYREKQNIPLRIKVVKSSEPFEVVGVKRLGKNKIEVETNTIGKRIVDNASQLFSLHVVNTGKGVDKDIVISDVYAGSTDKHIKIVLDEPIYGDDILTLSHAGGAAETGDLRFLTPFQGMSVTNEKLGNLIVDGDFEDGSGIWQTPPIFDSGRSITGKSEYSTSEVNGGTNSMHAVKNHDEDYFAFGNSGSFVLKDGVEYAYSYDYYVVETDGAIWEARISKANDNGTVAESRFFTSWTKPTVVGQWLTREHTVTGDGKKYTVYVLGYGTNKKINAFFDNFKLYENDVRP